jgi:hypothetical protein
MDVRRPETIGAATAGAAVEACATAGRTEIKATAAEVSWPPPHCRPDGDATR